MDTPKPVKEIPDWALRAFKEEMVRREVDLTLYNLLYFEGDEVYVVATSYHKKPPRYRGSVEGFPDYEVTISRKSRQVEKVSNVR